MTKLVSPLYSKHKEKVASANIQSNPHELYLVSGELYSYLPFPPPRTSDVEIRSRIKGLQTFILSYLLYFFKCIQGVDKGDQYEMDPSPVVAYIAQVYPASAESEIVM